MHQSDMHHRGDPHSLAPILLEGPSVQEEVAQLKRGRGLRLALNLISLAAIAIGGAKWLSDLDTQSAYNQAAAQLDRSESQRAQAYMRCVLPDFQPSQLTSKVTLYGTIEYVSEHLGKAYGDQIAACAPLLDDFERAVHKVTAPSNMTRHLQQVSQSATDFKRSWLAYQDYLQKPNDPYDYVKAAPLIDQITINWQSYRDTNLDVRAALAQAR